MHSQEDFCWWLFWKQKGDWLWNDCPKYLRGYCQNWQCYCSLRTCPLLFRTAPAISATLSKGQGKYVLGGGCLCCKHAWVGIRFASQTCKNPKLLGWTLPAVRGRFGWVLKISWCVPSFLWNQKEPLLLGGEIRLFHHFFLLFHPFILGAWVDDVHF